MTKFIQIALFIACAAICCAEPARLRNNRQSRVLARQEVAQDVASEDVPAQTPYPPAGIVPQVRFDLPTENVAVEPDNTYLPPNNAPCGTPAKTYGPPEAVEPESADPKAANDDVDEVTEEPEVGEEEAETEQPETSDQPEEQDPINDEAEDNEVETDPVDDEELLLVVPLSKVPRTKTARLQAPLRAQRVVARPIPYRSQRLIGQELFFVDGRYLAYTPQYVRV